MKLRKEEASWREVLNWTELVIPIVPPMKLSLFLVKTAMKLISRFELHFEFLDCTFNLWNIQCLKHLKMIKCPNLFNSYTNAIFFAAQVVTTIGYGNQYPRSNNGMIFIIFYALIFVPIGSFSSRHQNKCFEWCGSWCSTTPFKFEYWWKYWKVNYAMGMYALLFRQFVFWIRTKVWGEDATTLQRYLTTFVVMVWFKNE